MKKKKKSVLNKENQIVDKEYKSGREEQLNPQAMFGHRETLMEAFDYAQSIIERGPKESYIYNLTALMVIWNTLAKSYEPLKRK